MVRKQSVLRAEPDLFEPLSRAQWSEATCMRDLQEKYNKTSTYQKLFRYFYMTKTLGNIKVTYLWSMEIRCFCNFFFFLKKLKLFYKVFICFSQNLYSFYKRTGYKGSKVRSHGAKLR